MAEAWDLARRTNPDWCSGAGGDEQVQHLVRLQAALAKASLSP
jgi:hypothetical protein